MCYQKVVFVLSLCFYFCTVQTSFGFLFIEFYVQNLILFLPFQQIFKFNSAYTSILHTHAHTSAQQINHSMKRHETTVFTSNTLFNKHKYILNAWKQINCTYYNIQYNQYVTYIYYKKKKQLKSTMQDCQPIDNMLFSKYI